MTQTDFRILAEAIFGPEVATDDNQIELVLADRELVVRLQPSADGTRLLTDFFLRDVMGFRPESLPTLHRAILTINDLAARVGDYSVGIDGREIMVLTGIQPLKGLTRDRYVAAFVRWLEQVDLLRETVAAIGMENFSISYTSSDLAAPQEAEA